MADFEGIVIAESLEDRGVLDGLEIVATEVQAVGEWHCTPWLAQWTLHTVRVAADEAPRVAEALSRAIDREHAVSWYADFKDERHHYVIFRGSVFYIDRWRPEEYQAAVDYGIAAGLPEHQADFVSLIEP